MLTPTRSVGSRSGVNWTRFQLQSIDAAMALARLVLPTPGTSSMSRWPSASRQMTARSIDSFLPCTTRATLPVIASNSEANVRVSWFWVTVTRNRVDGDEGIRCSEGTVEPVTDCYLAIDVGGTKLAAGVVDGHGEVLVRDRIATPHREVWPALSK